MYRYFSPYGISIKSSKNTIAGLFDNTQLLMPLRIVVTRRSKASRWASVSTGAIGSLAMLSRIRSLSLWGPVWKWNRRSNVDSLMTQHCNSGKILVNSSLEACPNLEWFENVQESVKRTCIFENLFWILRENESLMALLQKLFCFEDIYTHI